MSNPTSTPTPSFGIGKIVGIAALALLILGGTSAFERVDTTRKAYRPLQTQVVQNRKDIVAVIDKVYNELKTAGVITKDFQALEANNVKVNMESQRAVALGFMSMFNNDLRQISAPTNGMMQLQHSVTFSKDLMEILKQGAQDIVTLKKTRNANIAALENFDAGIIDAWVVKHCVDNKDFDLKFEKEWEILTGSVDKAKKGGVVNPVNPLGKNADIQD